MHIRWMIRHDVPDVLRIDAAGGFRRPLDEGTLLAALRERDVITMVAEDGDVIAAFMIYRLHKTRLELGRIAVLPDCRRMGVGRTMLENLVNKLVGGLGRDRVALSVPEENLPAQLWLKACGFRAVPRGETYRFVRRSNVADNQVGRAGGGVVAETPQGGDAPF